MGLGYLLNVQNKTQHIHFVRGYTRFPILTFLTLYLVAYMNDCRQFQVLRGKSSGFSTFDFVFLSYCVIRTDVPCVCIMRTPYTLHSHVFCV